MSGKRRLNSQGSVTKPRGKEIREQKWVLGFHFRTCKKKKKMREEDQGRLPGGGNPGPNDEMGLVRRRGGMKEKGFSF